MCYLVGLERGSAMTQPPHDAKVRACRTRGSFLSYRDVGGAQADIGKLESLMAHP